MTGRNLADLGSPRENPLIVLDFDKHEVRYLYGDEVTAYQQQVNDQWCSTHTHAVRGLVSKLCCPYCLTEAAEDTQ